VRRVVPNRSLAPFRHRTFAMFWTGAFVSNIGTWMETVAIGAYVTEKTGQAAWTGAVAAAGFVPVAVLGPIGGALADRLPRRLLLLTTTFVQAALAALLTVLFLLGEPSAPVVTLVVFASGIASSIGFPAYQALLPDLVPADELPGAIGLASAQWNLGRVIGPVLAGVVITLGGYAWALGINAASFLAVVAVLLAITLPPPVPAPDGEGIFDSIREGVRFVRRDPGLRVSVGAMCLNTFLAAPFIALVPAMAIKVFDAGDSGVSVLVTAQGIGAVAMGVALGGLNAAHGSRRVLVSVLAGLPLALVLYAYAPSLALSAVALVVVGALYLGAFSTFTTIAQLRSPARLRGRVLSVNMVVLGVLYPLGALLQGRLADAIGLRATTALAGAAMAATMLVVHLVRPHLTAAIDAPTSEDAPGAAADGARVGSAAPDPIPPRSGESP
jgi:MFS family permease